MSGLSKNQIRLKKQTVQNSANANYPGSVTFYGTRPGNMIGSFYNVPEPTRDSREIERIHAGCANWIHVHTMFGLNVDWSTAVSEVVQHCTVLICRGVWPWCSVAIGSDVDWVVLCVQHVHILRWVQQRVHWRRTRRSLLETLPSTQALSILSSGISHPTLSSSCCLRSCAVT